MQLFASVAADSFAILSPIFLNVEKSYQMVMYINSAVI